MSQRRNLILERRYVDESPLYVYWLITKVKIKSRFYLIQMPRPDWPCVTHLGEALPHWDLYLCFHVNFHEEPDQSFYASPRELIMKIYSRTKVLKPWKIAKNVNPVLVFDEAASHLTEKVQKALRNFANRDSRRLNQYFAASRRLKSIIRRWLAWTEIQNKLGCSGEWSLDAMSSLSQESIMKSDWYWSRVGRIERIRSSSFPTNIFSHERDLLDDEENPYDDNTERTIRQLGIDQELDLSDE